MRSGTRNPLRVAVVAYDGLCTFEFGVAVEVFGLPRPELDPWYELHVGSLEPGPLRATGGIRIDVRRGLGVLDRAGTIVIPGWRDLDEVPPERLLRKLRRAHEQGARLLSICSGVFVLAATGILDGLRATTHWRYSARLARDHPNVDVDPDVLYVDEGNVLTSAGSAAGIDLCLHVVRCDFGASIANQVARRLVVPPHREGGQSQYIDAPLEDDRAAGKRDGLAAVLDRVRQQIAEPHCVASMARAAHMSERTFARRFRARTGTTPHRWITRERIQRAQTLLETTDLSLERVAEGCGFSEPQLLRFHFKQSVGTSPSAYRRAFR